MNIEQRLAESIRSFGLDSLAGAVPLDVVLDVVLTVLVHTVCAAMRRRLPGYATTTPDILQRRFLQSSGESSTTATRSPSDSTGGPTHPSSAKPNSLPSPSLVEQPPTQLPIRLTRVELAA